MGSPEGPSARVVVTDGHLEFCRVIYTRWQNIVFFAIICVLVQIKTFLQKNYNFIKKIFCFLSFLLVLAGDVPELVNSEVLVQVGPVHPSQHSSTTGPAESIIGLKVRVDFS